MATKPTARNEWIFGALATELPDKATLVKDAFLTMLNRTTRMFKYKNLPETIPQKDLETYIQVGGYAIVSRAPDGKLYTFTGGLGGEPDVYYLPTIATVANPALKFSENFKIDENCVVIRNDNYYQGLRPILNKYAILMTEGEISLKYAMLNARVPSLIQADNDNTHKSAEEFFKKIREGSDYGIIASQEFFDGIRAQSFYTSTYIKDIIEAIQYVKGTMFNEIGLSAQFSMKREAINEAEASMNEDILFPLIDTMLECRKEGVRRVNEMFGTNIFVELDSVWEDKEKLEDIRLETAEGGVDNEVDRDTDTNAAITDSAEAGE